MRVATFNINGIGSRLPALLEYLEEKKPDVACLQELKAPQERFPLAEINAAGYGAIWLGQKSWNGVAILARGQEPVEVTRGLPGDDSDEQSRYLEAVVGELVVACLYLPNGNPAPGPKFDYKLAWFERLIKRAQQLLDTAAPVVIAGDYNVMPTELDVYKPERWLTDACSGRNRARHSTGCSTRAGRTRCVRCTRTKSSTPSTTISGTPTAATRACASTTCCSARRWRRPCARRAPTTTSAARKSRATTCRPGSSWT